MFFMDFLIFAGYIVSSTCAGALWVAVAASTAPTLISTRSAAAETGFFTGYEGEDKRQHY